MGYTIGSRIAEFNELSTDNKLVCLLSAIEQLHAKIDSLIEKRPEIEPCPVCGNSNIKSECVGEGTFMRFCSRCIERRLGGNIHLGPVCATIQEALTAWNKQSRELRGLKP